MAIRLDLARPVTDEEILLLSQRNPGYRFERTAEGMLVVTPSGGKSGQRSAAVLGQLYAWNLQAEIGVVFDSSTGFRLPDGSLLSPDASWIGRTRWEALTPEQQEGFVPLCPDAVFELRSPSDDLADLRRKMQAYLAGGARLAVLIDPFARAVEVYRPDEQPVRHEQVARLGLDPELPGFVLDLAPVFSA